MRFALGIFAKEPLAGKVKTRLSPPLTPQQAADFYRLSLDETIQQAQANLVNPPLLFYSGDRGYFREHYPHLEHYAQQGDDLGARMEHALALLLERFDAAALIGTDTPDLPPAILAEACDALASHDVVVAPSSDGGYVLIGERRHHRELFRGVPWSTPGVLTATRRLASEHAISLAEITEWEDVDDIGDLRRLCTRSPQSRSAAWVKRHLPPTRG